jgi:hypothetical protein
MAVAPIGRRKAHQTYELSRERSEALNIVKGVLSMSTGKLESANTNIFQRNFLAPVRRKDRIPRSTLSSVPIQRHSLDMRADITIFAADG